MNVAVIIEGDALAADIAAARAVIAAEHAARKAWLDSCELGTLAPVRRSGVDASSSATPGTGVVPRAGHDRWMLGAVAVPFVIVAAQLTRGGWG